jgi:phosphatidylserine/phosphatidylglycerophosphate/cardiolipin synthase-like enzyme
VSAPTDLLLSFTSDDFGSPLGDGRPWGDGTEMAGRANPSHPRPPWDAGCTVSSYVGGHAAMEDYRETLDTVIKAAEASSTPAFVNGAWQRGHVYIVDWRFNCLRDLSTNTNPWPRPPGVAAEDATAIGLVRRLMQAGVQVRLLLWYPTYAATFSFTAAIGAHVEDHRYAAALVEAENRRLMDTVFSVPAGSDPLGVVALDMRTAEGSSTGSLHQKMMLVRTPTIDVAFAGGVDLAYTRRDAPLAYGDWQSGNNMPPAGPNWPHPVDPLRYATVATATPVPSTPQGSDLPIADRDGRPLFGPRQSWHDQHLRLTGPIVATLEHQFGERWRDTANYYSIQDSDTHVRAQQVIFSAAEALVAGNPVTTRPLPLVAPAAQTGNSTVQMWRTIPWRDSRTGPPFTRAEFTVLAGISHAVNQARQLIWIFDQYFWSRSLATQLHRQLRANPGLRLIIVLPPHADDPSNAAKQHQARFDALSLVMNASGTSVANQVGVYSMWNSHPPAPELQPGRGMYVHAKVQMYDGNLLVCGSANLNRRSLLCDAELALAVADPTVVAAHQRKLWELLFPGGSRPWPAPDFSQPGSGALFFDAFAQAVGVTTPGTPGPSRLILDPWNADGHVLPGEAFRERNGSGWYYNKYYRAALDPSSLDDACEQHRPSADNNSEWAPLDWVSQLLEKTVRPVKGNKPPVFPYRQQA